MKTRLLSAVAVGAFLALPSMAAAQEGWYVRGALGYGTPSSADVSGGLNGGINGKSNWREALAVGFQSSENWRMDFELSHRFNQTGAVGAFEGSDSNVHAWSLMATAIYDFPGGDGYRPYIGAGLGAVQSTFRAIGLDTGTAVATSNTVVVRDKDWALGYHLLAGIGWTLTVAVTAAGTGTGFFPMRDMLTSSSPGQAGASLRTRCR